MFSFMFYLKSFLVGTRLEYPAKKLRWLLGTKQRLAHPELWEVYLEEKRIPLVLQRILSGGSCGVDVGAHIGSFLSLLSQYAPHGRHIAFEPSAIKGGLLKRRFPNATIYNFAVSDRTGVAFFQEDYSQPGYSRLQGAVKSPVASSNTYEVKTCRLDDLLLEIDRLDLIKLDIEGAELVALRGATQVIHKFRPTIIFECGTEYGLIEERLDRRELYDFISHDLKYEIFTFTDFLFEKGPMTFDEFRKCGLFPFRAFNFVALPQQISDNKAVR